MRPIKFRVWDTVNQEWFDETTAILSQNSKLHFWNMYKSILETLEEDTYVPVFFTWLLDKNGKEIYEGDIFDSLYKFDWCTGKYVVEYLDRVCCFAPIKLWKHQQESVSISMADLTRLEIIWNIYENPELLTNP